MKKVLLILPLLLGLVSVAKAQTFNCNKFSTTGTCGVGSGQAFNLVGNTGLTIDSTGLVLFPTGATHAVSTLIYQTPVNTHSFATSFTFIPNGLWLSLIFNNTTNVPGYQGASFQGGAGCEADFFQGYGVTNPPNNVFAVTFDGYDPLNPNQTAPYDFAYSSVQAYQSNLKPPTYPNVYVQCPCIGGSDICGTNTTPSDGLNQIAKLSTAPVPLNNPATTVQTTTGDTYSAIFNYDGVNLTLNLSDVSKNGSCPGPTCFTHTWNNIDITTSSGGGTAWVGLGASSNGPSMWPLYIKSFTYGPDARPPDQPTPVPTASATPSAGCSFTTPQGTVTWSCSPTGTLSTNPTGALESHSVWNPESTMERRIEPTPVIPMLTMPTPKGK